MPSPPEVRWLFVVAIASAAAAAAAAQPQDPLMSRMGIVVREVGTFPKSEPTPAPTDPRLMRRARINYLGEIPDSSARKFVPDLNGTLYVLTDTIARAYLDVRSAIGANFFSGRGLGSGFGFVAFHPAFSRNGKFYTVHTEALDALASKTPDAVEPRAVVHGVVTEWTADNPRASTFTGTHREILRFGFATYIHGIQQIDFTPTARRGDPDYGLLYVAVGDGGIGVSSDIPQDTTVPFGKILRVDPATGKWEVFARGMRDPYRFSWDPGARHRMLLAHIGEHHVESIYDVRKGDNLGWSERDGPLVFDKQDHCAVRVAPGHDGYDYPVAAYGHDAPAGFSCDVDVGHAISGGFVYRGRAVPALTGKYVFADLVDGRVMSVDEREMRRGAPRATIHELAIFDTAGRETTMSLLAGDARVDLRFGRDAAGELYLLSKANGTVWKIVGTRRASPASTVFPSLLSNLVAWYDFEHPDPRDSSLELDRAPSGTAIRLINGGARMRLRDGSIQLGQRPGANDDWKAGVYADSGVRTLSRFNAARGATVMGWFKVTGVNPSAGYDAAGLAGVLSGTSDGHLVRALIELITVNGELKLAAVGRRVDGERSQTLIAPQPWTSILPLNKWVFLAATFDFVRGSLALYSNGKSIAAAPNDSTLTGASPSDPRGIKIGGSFPQNTAERNPCNCRADDLMFFDRVLTPLEVNQQYRRMVSLGREHATR